ncbi:MAG: M48 family metalloprotease [Betaproteobacteria bacterium]
MRSRGAVLGIVCASAMLGGCAISLHDGRPQPAAPKPISAVYSQFNLKLRLLLATDSSRRGEECSAPECFDRRVAALGPKIAQSAYEVYPEFACQVKELDFIVADKREPATLSSALGRVVVFRAVENVAYTDAALAFILAREVGHVVAQHHEQNTAYGLFVSGVAHLLMPVASLAKAIAETFSGVGAAVSTGATVAANASLSATSMAGSQVALEVQSRTQQDEADDIALRILGRLGIDGLRIRQSFGKADPKLANEWMAKLYNSIDRLSDLPEYERESYFQAAVRTDAPACRFEHQPEPLILGML